MGIIDTAKTLRKAQQAKSRMSKIEAVGRSKSGNLAILLNGLSKMVEAKAQDELLEGLTAKKLEKEIIEAYNDAHDDLEKQMAATMSADGNMDMDAIRKMFGV